MKTLYVDHQVIAREIAGHAANWELLRKLLADNPQWRLAVSEYNLLEIASDGDKARATRRAAFLDSLSPVWIMERLDIQKNEVQAFLWRNHFRTPWSPPSIFKHHLLMVLAYHTRPLIGATAQTWVASIDPSEIAEAKRQTVRSLQTLQAATKHQKNQIEAETFRAWVYPKIPLRDPEGRLMSKAQKQNLVEVCYAASVDFYRECTAIGVEHFLCQVRTQDPNRSPRSRMPSTYSTA